MSEHSNELAELRRLGLVGTLEPTTQTAALDRALLQLGGWLLPEMGTEDRRRAAQSYIKGRTRAAQVASTASWTVSGVIHRDKRTKTEITVAAVAMNGTTQPLATGETTESGFFELVIAGPRPPVIELRLGKGTATIGPSSTDGDLWFEWKESSSAPDRRDGGFEFQRRRLTELVGASDPGSSLPDLDAAVVAAHAGLPVAYVRRHQWSHALAAEIGTTEAIAWILLDACEKRQAIGSTLWLADSQARIAQMTPGAIRSEVERAVETRKISAENLEKVPELMHEHRLARIDTWLATPVDDQAPTRGTWGDLVRAIGLSKAALEAEEAVWDGDLDGAWKRLANRITDSSASGHHPAWASLVAWASMVDLDHRALDLLKAAKLGDVESTVSTLAPADVAKLLEPVGGGLAQRFLGRLEAGFPGQAVLWELKDQLGPGIRALFDAKLLDLDRLTLALWQSKEDQSAGDEKAKKAKADRARKLPVQPSAIRGRAAVPIPVLPKQTLTELTALQRLHRIGKTKAHTLALRRARYRSAQQIAFEGGRTFREAMKKQGIDATESSVLKARAVARHRATTSAYVDRIARRNSAPAGPRSAPAAAQTAAATAADSGIPTLTMLFGPQDYCACEDCESVISQSAYLVDLLIWLNGAEVLRASDGSTLTGYAAVTGKRPDIVKVELSCDNTEIEVPHIDLVCELLENLAAPDLGLTAQGPYQTTGTAEEIRAYPQHLNPAVYAALKSPTSPGYWPFDADLAEVRAYLAKRSGNRTDLVSAFGAATDLPAEVLALSAPQATIVVGIANDPNQTANQTTIWGVAPANVTAADVMTKGALFLGAPLVYDALLSLLSCPFITQGATLQIELLPDNSGQLLDTCQADLRGIVQIASGAPAPIDASVLDRLYRLLRLASTIGWAPIDTGSVLTMLAASDGTIDTSKVAGALQLAQRFGLTPLEIATFFGSFDADPNLASFFQQVFSVRGALVTSIPDALVALGVSVSDGTQLLGAVGLTSTSDASPSNLALLFRHVRLANALTLSISDYVTRASVCAFSFVDPSSVLAFVASSDLLAVAGIGTSTLVQLTDSTLHAPNLDALWAALLAVQGRYPPTQDGSPVKIPFADGLWRQAIGTWLGIANPAAAPELDIATADLASQIQTVLSWPTWDGVSALPATGQLTTDQQSAIDTLWRFHLIASAPAGGSTLPYGSNPALVTAAQGGTSAWPTALFPYLSFLQAGGGAMLPAANLLGTAPTAAIASTFATAVGISLDDATVLLTAAVDSSTAGTNGWGMVALRLALLGTLDLPATVLAGVAAPVTAASSAALRSALQSAVGPDQWLALSSTVQDALRPQRRDALTSFFANERGLSVQKLSDQLLIDVATSAPRTRSRIGEACSAIQTFVTRAILGEEYLCDTTDPDTDSLWTQWEWRKRYATWSGNRLVFLFPENYLTVSNRATITPLFTQFQQSVSRGSVTVDNVTAALVDYLDGLTELADLEYLAIGSDYSPETDDTVQPPVKPLPTRALTLIGRTRGAPGKYFFNQLMGGAWTFFEEIPIGEDPSHVTILSDTQRNILFWPKSTLYPNPLQPPASSSDATQANMVLATKYSWTRRGESADWSAPRTTSGALLYNGQVLTERTVLLQATSDSQASPVPMGPDEYSLLAFLPSAGAMSVPSNLAQSTFTATSPALMSIMVLRNDTTGKTAHQHSDGSTDAFNVWFWLQDPQTTKFKQYLPKDWTGPAPADELLRQYNATAVIPVSSDADPYIVAWSSDLVFDQNRMRSVSADQSVPKVTVPAGATLATTAVDIILKPATPYSICGLPWRLTDADARGLIPSSWAFVVSGTSWSFFVIEKDSWANTKESLAIPAGWNYFLSTHPFTAVPAYHPFAYSLLSYVKSNGLDGLYQWPLQRTPGTVLGVGRTLDGDLGLNTAAVFVPLGQSGQPATEEIIDFTGISPYQTYNWELFYHAPMAIAIQLRATKQFENARSFFHCVFNPLQGNANMDSDRPWWITAAFDEDANDQQTLEEILAGGGVFAGIEADPFDPHEVAVGRPAAYERWTVMEYVGNLLDWANSLYALGDSEDVDEASQLFDLASLILGPPPLEVDPLGALAPRAFNQPSDWTQDGNALVSIENLIGDIPDSGTAGGAAPVIHLPLAAADSSFQRLYFAVPRNQALLDLWAAVAQGQQSVRAWQSLDGGDGITTTTDVAALITAAAAGAASLSAALYPFTESGLVFRFRILVAKALELCSEARSLGAAVLSASERQDAEALATIRSTWQGNVLSATRLSIVNRQQESQNELAAVQASIAATLQHQNFYQALATARTTAAEEAAFDLNVAGAVIAGVASALEIIAAPATAFPNLTIGIAGTMASPVSTVTIGGGTVGAGMQQAARGVAAVGGIIDRTATMVATQAGYDRRAEEWQQRADEAGLELVHLNNQLLAAQARVQIANCDLAAHDRQISAWQAEDDYLTAKFSNTDLYVWLLGQSSALYVQAYQLAVDMARRASTAYGYELSTVSSAPAAPTFAPLPWDSAHRGLLAADGLAFTVRQMEADYLRFATSDVYVVRKFSLKQLASGNLIDLRKGAAGGARCTIPVPAWWLARLDTNLSNFYLRAVSVSIPCVGGANASLNATLSVSADGGPPNLPLRNLALSTGLNDYGCDMSTRSERYLPFEGMLLSNDTEWQLTFSEFPEIDVSTISDVVLQLEYTASIGSEGSSVSFTSWTISIDLQLDAPDVWQALFYSAALSAQFDPTRFLPAVLADFTELVDKSVAVTTEGTGIGPGNSGNTITLTGTSGVDPTGLGPVVIQWQMKQPGQAASAGVKAR